jgi:hypothetical protein
MSTSGSSSSNSSSAAVVMWLTANCDDALWQQCAAVWDGDGAVGIDGVPSGLHLTGCVHCAGCWVALKELYALTVGWGLSLEVAKFAGTALTTCVGVELLLLSNVVLVSMFDEVNR